VPPTPRFHYGWVIVGTGMLCILACLGFGRFALGMILPSMTASLHLSYSQAGYISAGNFLGYLLAVLGCGHVAARTGARALIFVALLVVGASMFLMSRASGFGTLLVLYTVTGMGSGATNVPVMGVITRWFDRRMRGWAAGFVSIGSGFAIIASGRLVPYLNRTRGAEGWRTSWLVLAAAVTGIALLALTLFRNRPEDMGLRPAGALEPAPPSPAAPAPAGAPLAPAGYRRQRGVVLLGLLYAAFGYTYAIYVTFIVTSLVRERGFSEATAGRFWSAVGLLSLLSGPVFGLISDRLGRRAGLRLVFSLQLLAYLLAGAPLPGAFIYLSIGIFGLVAWSVPTIMVAAVSDHVGPERALPAFGFITFFFGMGQITGPSVAGLLAERTGGFSSSFLMAAAVAAAAVAATGLMGRPARALAPGAAVR
jgi:MFS family permease